MHHLHLTLLHERVAAIALGYDRAARVTVTIHKPAAPITVPFDDVSVTITRSRPPGQGLPIGPASIGSASIGLASIGSES